jgi:hypothetical protein
MRAVPDDFDATALAGVLAGGWGFDVETLEYAALGGGTYHWIAAARDGTRGFVSVDDLDRKPWLGNTREAAFDGLARAFDTALALRNSGLDFVVAPSPTRRSETVLRVGPRYTVALFPFVIGQPGRFGHYEPAEHAAILALLAELHQATPAVASVARRMELELPGRSDLEDALASLDQTWTGGPFSEPARQALAAHAEYVAELLALADRLRLEVAAQNGDWVITHGEPHAGNVLRTGEGYVLVDWDTVALGPRERDLWMLADDTTGYTDATGHEPDEVAVAFFRLSWDLADIAAFTNQLRSPHSENEDSAKALEALTRYVATG